MTTITVYSTVTFALREECPYSELFWSVFSHIWNEYREILRISPYSVRMRENADQNNSEYGHFLRSVDCLVEMCEDYEGEANYTWICGEGAISCTGFVLKPQCECDTDNYYISSADGRMCIPGISFTY